MASNKPKHFAQKPAATKVSTPKARSVVTKQMQQGENPYAQTGAKEKKSNLLSNILMAVGVILLLVAAGMWIHSQKEYSAQDQAIQELVQYAQVSDETGATGEPVPPKVDWAGLKAVNGDVCGWIQIPGTVINYPVYQGVTNDQYLRTLADGSYGIGGLIFLDSENIKPGMIDSQSIIYGHHLKNGAMFKRIADMDNQDMFDSVKTVWYETENKAYRLKPLLLYYGTPEDETIRRFNFDTTEQFHEYLDGKLSVAKAKSPTAAEDIQKAQHVLTMSTCNYIEGAGRSVLICVDTDEVGI